ncbi:hypothetical protein PIB30_067555 [Stylosanthes scabra]|uniref:Uncharacterized protein n=1 Tax=Stylosanthes scabra TaxID=79078 RepID=A0ABU6UQ45_9FABA|nr:hypothetical protein [Stylosanthes scabra]
MENGSESDESSNLVECEKGSNWEGSKNGDTNGKNYEAIGEVGAEKGKCLTGEHGQLDDKGTSGSGGMPNASREMRTLEAGEGGGVIAEELAVAEDSTWHDLIRSAFHSHA